MAALTTQKPSAAGVALTYAAAAVGGDTFVNSGKEFIHIVNASGSTVTVTFASPNTCSYGVTNAAHNKVVTLLTLTDKMIGPFDRSIYNSGAGNVAVTYSAVTDVTVAVVAPN